MPVPRNWPKKPPSLQDAVKAAAPESTVEVLALDTTVEETRTSRGRPHRQGATMQDKKKLSYSPDLPERMLDRFAGFLSDEDYLSLQGEIAAVRTLFVHMLSEWTEYVENFNPDERDENGKRVEPPKPPFSVPTLLSGAEQISRLVERQHRILYSDANLITVEAAVAFVLMTGQIVNTFVKDVQERADCLDALRKLLLQGKSFQVNATVSRRLLSPVLVEEELGEMVDNDQ